ncbi:pimeloyl-ACP methyl ester carboxylesterase [Humitalea rosea]|uniref:Pimeloyl-ACP methyl ester carboxylesterase n=1 Tax=Humitalea rosea TaxID=990373 RepID=A0A2W7KE18_9PROT|nr:alpha/beta hydrolase [Humitalea rosea]PZW45950.1 pimeloyl-ACP methyl ester carboxylesterase [Humitalea rosea]
MLDVHEAGQGPCLVLIPSLGRGQEDYDGIAPGLVAAGFSVIRAEPRGIGGSTPAAAGATLHDLAADLAALIRAPAIVVGHAFGNWIARVLAHDRPELVRGVAMLAALTGTGTDPAIRQHINGSFDPSLPDAERLVHLQTAYFAPGHDARVWLPGWHPAVARAQRAASAATTGTGWLRAGERHPLLYVAAAQDAIAPLPSEAEVRAALGPRAIRVVIEDAGHALLPEQPQAVIEALVSFARSLP